MDEDGEAAAEEEVVAEQNDKALVEATEIEHLQASPRYKMTTNTPTKRPAKSTCWERTRRLTSYHPKANENGGSHTHVFTEDCCLNFYKLLKPAGMGYLATNPVLKLLKAVHLKSGGAPFQEIVHLLSKFILVCLNILYLLKYSAPRIELHVSWIAIQIAIRIATKLSFEIREIGL